MQSQLALGNTHDGTHHNAQQPSHTTKSFIAVQGMIATTCAEFMSSDASCIGKDLQCLLQLTDNDHLG